MNSVRETNEDSMVAAHKAGIAYWHAHRAFWKHGETPRIEALVAHARSCGWHGADCEAWLAGFYGEKCRDNTKREG